MYIPFVTEDGDTIHAMAVIPRPDEDVCLVATEGGVHRLRWMPFDGNSPYRTGRSQSQISSDGIVGRKAHCVINNENHRLFVWLSRQGLRMTNGGSWGDACEDWSVETAGLSASDLDEAVLYNDDRYNRIVLHAKTATGNVTWHFYYHQTHLKFDGNRKMGLKAIGPHAPAEFANDSVVSATTARSGGRSAAWVATKREIYREHQGLSSEMNVLTREQYFDNRYNDAWLQTLGLTHNAGSDKSIVAIGYASSPEDDGTDVKSFGDFLESCTHDGATKMVLEESIAGTHVWSRFVSQVATDDHVWGPAGMDVGHHTGDST
jgi:hypothetical protein